jgi:hypothetical protein
LCAIGAASASRFFPHQFFLAARLQSHSRRVTIIALSSFFPTGRQSGFAGLDDEATMQFSATLLLAGRPIADSVTGSLEESNVAGMHTWKGVLFVAPIAVIEIGCIYTLALDSGRTGEILILKTKDASTTVASYEFSGMGPLD